MFVYNLLHGTSSILRKAIFNRLLLFLCPLNTRVTFLMQFFPTAEESINYYNQKRCVDGKGLILPSQIVRPSNLLLL